MTYEPVRDGLILAMTPCVCALQADPPTTPKTFPARAASSSVRVGAVYVLLLCLPLSCWASTLLEYDARIAFLNAGRVAVEVERDTTRYAITGEAKTSAALAPFYNWSSQFAAIGRFEGGQPKSEAYVMRQDKKDDRSVLLAANGRVGKHDDSGRSKEAVAPVGTDLVSVLFATDGCYRDPDMHDGEDGYDVKLVEAREVKLKQKSRYYSGPATRCSYETLVKDRKRKVHVWMAAIAEQVVPVKVQVQVPSIPDGFLRLIMP